MKKIVSVVLLIMLMLAVPASADTVEKIELQQVLGAFANYSAGTGTIVWSGGAAGWLYTDGGNVCVFDGAQASATYTGVQDTSSDGLASAYFTTGTWSLLLNDAGSTRVSITGHIAQLYSETETGVSTDALNGRAVVVVDTATFDNTYFQNTYGTSIGWDAVGGQAGLVADVTLPYGFGITDYQSDYSSSNMIVTLWADSSVIPEPATMFLLGLGALTVLRRR